jgi:hypothetical protein
MVLYSQATFRPGANQSQAMVNSSAGLQTALAWQAPDARRQDAFLQAKSSKRRQVQEERRAGSLEGTCRESPTPSESNAQAKACDTCEQSINSHTTNCVERDGTCLWQEGQAAKVYAISAGFSHWLTPLLLL